MLTWNVVRLRIIFFIHLLMAIKFNSAIRSTPRKFRKSSCHIFSFNNINEWIVYQSFLAALTKHTLPDSVQKRPIFGWITITSSDIGHLCRINEMWVFSLSLCLAQIFFLFLLLRALLGNASLDLPNPVQKPPAWNICTYINHFTGHIRISISQLVHPKGVLSRLLTAEYCSQHLKNLNF